METGADSETGLCLHLPLRARFLLWLMKRSLSGNAKAIMNIIWNGRAVMNEYNCTTIEQFYIYKWIDENFIIDRLRIGYCNKNTIYVIDQEDSYMTASYSKGRIILLYNVNNQISSEVIPLKKTQLGYIAS